MSSGRRPRVLYLLDSLVPGGAEISTVELLPELVERGIDAEVAMLLNRPGLQDQVRDLGLALHDASGPGGRVAAIRRIRELVGAREPDLVHTTLYEADVCGRTAAVLTGTPYVSTLATERYGEDHLANPTLDRRRIRAAQVVDALTARQAVRLHAVSRHVADAMARNLRYPRDRIDVVPRGRRPPEVRRSRDAVRGDLGIGDEPAILAVGRHEFVKGLDRLLGALAHVHVGHPGTVLLVAGRAGTHSDELDTMVDDLGLGRFVRFLGHRDDVTDLLAASDVFVLPSRREGSPGALIEAMAVGTPAVATDLPQVREVAGEGCARLVDAADAVALGCAISCTLDDRMAAAAMAAAARERFADAFTLDAVADGMVGFYERCGLW